MSYLFSFSYRSWGSQGKNTEVVCHSLLQWTTFCQTSPPWPACLGWPHRAWLSFIELDRAVVCVIWFKCVCPPMPSCNTYCLTWFSLTLDVGYLLMAAPAKRSRCSLPWMRGISSYYHMWNRWPVQVRCMKQGTQSRCTGTTQRDGMRREVGTRVHPWLIYVNVWQKPPQYCKVTSLQLKLIN